jgi:hypothetical protein
MKSKIQFICLMFVIITTACKKETLQPEVFDLKNYVVHNIYQETNGNGILYKAPQQLLLSFNNNQTDIVHVGSSNTQPFPINKSQFTIYDNIFSNTD